MKIICHGDSLTEGIDIERAYRWSSLLGNHLNCDVINHGIGGDTTAGMLSRFSFEVLQHRPDVVIILGGTNDLWWDLDTNIILANIASMVCQARHYGIAPVIGLPLPAWVERLELQNWEPPAKGYQYLDQCIQNLVSELKRQSHEWETPLLDFHDLFFNDKKELITDYFLDDGLHANRKGHLLMGKRAAQQFKEFFYLP